MEQKQTAVDWFATEIWRWFELKGDSALFDHLHSLAKEMEEEQIKDAFYQGVGDESILHGAMYLGKKDAEKYYNETYK